MKLICIVIVIAFHQFTLKAQILDNEKDRLGYSSGYINGQYTFHKDIYTSEEFNHNEISNGFKDGFQDLPLSDVCSRLFNETNPDSIQSGDMLQVSYCQGQKSGYEFYKAFKEFKMLDKMSLEFVKLGMEDYLLDQEPAIPVTEMKEIVEGLKTELSNKHGLEPKERNAKIQSEAEKWTNSIIYDNGIVIATIKKGRWFKKPKLDAFINVNYLAYNNFNTVIDDDFKVNLFQAELSNLIEGWKFSLTKMKKKGKYKVYIPSYLAYDDGDLIYEISLVSFRNNSK